jgi:hypothetical protein
MTVETLAIELETAYWQNNITRVAVGDAPREDEAFAARAHLPVLCRHTARAAARWGRKSHRPARFQPPFVADTVAAATERQMRADPTCGILIETIGWLLLRQLLQNLAWRFALWLFSDSTSEDRPDLLCRMEAAE